jgi:uncharacterized membrane protein
VDGPVLMLAYVGGTLGRARTFDGIFLSGLLAVVPAAL